MHRWRRAVGGPEGGGARSDPVSCRLSCWLRVVWQPGVIGQLMCAVGAAQLGSRSDPWLLPSVLLVTGYWATCGHCAIAHDVPAVTHCRAQRKWSRRPVLPSVP